MHLRIPHLASRLPIVALLSLSCATLGRLAFTEPDVELQEIAVTGIGLTGGTVELAFDVYNPNDVRTGGTRGGSGIRQLIDIQPPSERAFLVGAPRKGSADAVQVEDHLDELNRLADTAGAEVVGRTYQRVEAPSPNFYLGQGKVEELKGVLQDARSTLVLFDEPLSPVQGQNLETALDVRVMDRTEVILDIFATRARSAEAKMQVELAQLEYLLPRLTRMWTHLSRIRGGIRLRGPGETQLETDRRAIRRNIAVLKNRLTALAEHRPNQRQAARGVAIAAVPAS